MDSSTMLKRPSAFLPVAMSVSALAVIIAYIAAHGTAPQPDEGAAAHTWQLLMAGQVPVMIFFAAKWLPASPKQATRVLLVQIGAAIAAAAPVFMLGW